MSVEEQDFMIEEVEGSAVWLALAQAWSLLNPWLPAGSAGGHFCLVCDPHHDRQDRQTPITLMRAVIGRVSWSVFDRDAGLAGEAVDLLYSNEGHQSTLQSSCSGARIHPQAAAIRAARSDEERDLILAFAGLPEQACEALMLLTAVQMRWLLSETAGAIAYASSNDTFTRGMDAYRELQLLDYQSISR